MSRKPLGTRAYGHIPHLLGSRMGPGDHHCHAGQARICTVETRDRHDAVIVQEKLGQARLQLLDLGNQLLDLADQRHIVRPQRVVVGAQRGDFFCWRHASTLHLLGKSG